MSTTSLRFHRLLALCLLSVSGCATPADPSLMAVGPTPGERKFPEQLVQAMCVRNVSGGEETNPLWASKVGNQDFQNALTTSLTNANLSAPANACKYSVDVNLLGLSQPTLGLSAEVTSHANYKVYDTSAHPVLLQTISATYTAGFSESVIGVVRLKRANEGAIRASISQFLEKLRGTRFE